MIKINLIPKMKKICSKCGIEKDRSEFHKDNTRKDGLRSLCKECQKIYREENKERMKEKHIQYCITHKEQISEQQKQYKEIHKEQIKAQRKQRREENKEQIREQQKQYREKYKEKRKQYNQQYRKKNKEKRNDCLREKRKNDPCSRLRCYVSSRIRKMLKTQNSHKDNSILEYLPYTIQQLKEHIEFQFEPWMNWDNHGSYEECKVKWHIDHIVPCSSLPYDTLEHLNFQKCWSLENLRPLEAIENMRKGNKFIDIKKEIK